MERVGVTGERTDGSGTRWCAVYSRSTVQQVAMANIPASEYVPGVTEIAGYSSDASRKSATRVPVDQTATKIEHRKAK